MKIDLKKMLILLVLVVDCLIGWLVFDRVLKTKDQVSAKALNKTNVYEKSVLIVKETSKEIDLKIEEETRKALIVYDNMTMEEL